MDRDLTYMTRAYELALRGWGKTSPNPMVGAVVVRAGKIIAEGWHDVLGGPHAEAMALKSAGAKAKGADLYVTLEPCNHVGRTGPCSEAVIRSGVKRVFIGVKDANPLMNGKSVVRLRKAGIDVRVGFLEKELHCLNESFEKFMTTGRPFVTLKVAQTIDGKVATLSRESKWLTGKEARAYAKELRFGFDAILVGINTVLTDDPGLNANPRKRTKKIILDAKLRTPANAKLFSGSKRGDVFIFTACTSKKKLPAMIVPSPLVRGKIDLKWVLDYLGKQKVASVLIEGGPTVAANALQQKLVDKVMVYIAPKILGGGIDGFQDFGARVLGDAINLKNVDIGRIGPDLLIEGYI
jgi:diaminohydroxyphosphoribosylaminopyrimidine deaminase / 5-amino-6-(5-phosphoribosylamino)uracil reductase